MSRSILLACLVLLLLGLSGCGGGSSEACGSGDDPDIALPDAPVEELKLRDLRAGKGAVANGDTLLLVDYTGRALSSGSYFDSSWSRSQPDAVGLDEVITGWREGLQGMAEGGCRRLTIPGAQAYADNPPPEIGIGMNDTLVFEVALHRVFEPPTDIEVPSDPPTELSTEDLIGGVRGVVGPTSLVTVHFRGMSVASGESFQDTWASGETIDFAVDAGIAGLREGLQGMAVGGRRRIVIPAAKGYGPTPPQGAGIAPNDSLIYVVDLIAVTNPKSQKAPENS